MNEDALDMMRKSSTPCPDWVRHAEAIDGLERMEARFQGNAYCLHRHDTYAIGCTLAGVQRFHYRRGQRDSLPGNTMVLHPDESHDGQAGGDDGFHYRMIYVQPSLFQDVLCGQALPFIDGGVSSDPRLAAATALLLQPLNCALEPLEQSDGIAELAHALAAVAGMPGRRPKGDFLAARRTRDYLHANFVQVVTLDQLEKAAGRDRWSLSHDFRTFYGTSPYRYLTMRRLDAVRRMLLAGISLVHASAAAGFADQSHMTRHFSKTFGLTPGRWLRMVKGDGQR
ncbi:MULTISPECIES: AraC family transcriptional regulator [unclassified Janthinobacterium]|uniref:AraC family transcriptional regulator n=1 Tax=unclassified Janthinobacterium TaxID=2610881 RepID=UPI0017CDC7BD|nr:MULTISPECIES: AraC family transcriptional regulator [unclassified Janthinobacterium]MBB5371276.1 AraC-like DNA-binding protein [Janthinobacterium sp. K2C7]MBB5384082.1 AraC-like DNA-binding protein [Janthinobacterium sp. K2Li3]MBB5389458.1 AraC-like DNA-binding protein [Janthinobacterium sp. K2E3]